MKIKTSQRFRRQWRKLLNQTLENYGQRQVRKNADRLVFLVRILIDNPKYGFPELLLANKEREYRSLLLFGNYKIVYYAGKDYVKLEDIWNMRMSPERLTRPYNR